MSTLYDYFLFNNIINSPHPTPRPPYTSNHTRTSIFKHQHINLENKNKNKNKTQLDHQERPVQRKKATMNASNNSTDSRLYGEQYNTTFAPQEYIDLDHTPLLSTQSSDSTTNNDNNNNTLQPTRHPPAAHRDGPQFDHEDQQELSTPPDTPEAIALAELKDIHNNTLWYTSYQPHLFLFVLVLILTVCLRYTAPGYIPTFDMGTEFTPETLPLKENGGVPTVLNILTFYVFFYYSLLYTIGLFLYNCAIWWKFPLFSRRHYKTDVVLINGVEVGQEQGNNQKQIQQQLFLNQYLLPALPHKFLQKYYTRGSVLMYLAALGVSVIGVILTILNILLYSENAALLFTQRFIAQHESFPEDFLKQRDDFVLQQHQLAYSVVCCQVVVGVLQVLCAKRAYYRDRLVNPARYVVVTNVLSLFRQQQQ